MRGRRPTTDGSSVSLFPFLAVLLCTMGALIVILVVIAHQARAAAATKAAESTDADSAAGEEHAQQREMFQWRIEQLAAARAQTAETLKHDQLALSHLEDHLRRLRDRLQNLIDAATEMKHAGQSTAQQRQQAEAELARLEQEIALETERLSFAREQASRRQRSYSIVPYEGPNGTRRRPIFIECLADRVVLQPEGVVLRSDDFEGPLGPGNPLAAALRATREHLAATGEASGGEPYPLVLVRPSGIAAYYKVREAIESWGPEFGYELIGEEWNLEFPGRDTRLAEVQQRAVVEGRVYQQRIAMAAPSEYGRAGPVYRAAPHRGGIIRADGTGGFDSGELGDGSPGQSSRGGDAPSTSDAFPGFGSHDQTTREQPTDEQEGRDSGESNGAGAGGSAKDGSPGGNARFGESGSSSGAPGGTAPAAGTASNAFGSPADKRGKNWALPDATNSSVPVSRPVRVLCRADRLVILDRRDATSGRVVMLGPATENSLEAFVATLWEHMKPWGIAGNGLHWRPVLILQVGPQGQQRAAELRRLLSGSGIAFEDE